MRFHQQPLLLPDFELMYKGSDAVERKGVYYAINDEDHPATKLMQSPNKISRGMATQISLSVTKVSHLKYDTILPKIPYIKSKQT